MALSPRLASSATCKIPAHNIFTFDNIIFSSNFDNGNLARVERVPNRPYEFRIWSAPDNMGTEHQSRHCAWFYFSVTGLPMGCVLRIQVVNASSHPGLYKHDMRPVYRSNSTNQKWCRIKTSVRFIKEGDSQQLFFEHSIDSDNDKLQFAFTYPYTYTMMQNELDSLDFHQNLPNVPGSIFYQRELLTRSCDGRRVDLLTITSVDGMSKDREPLLPSIFPETKKVSERPPIFPEKEVIFISCRVHSGEVPGQHTFKGILDLLMDKDDLCGKELRARYVFKLIPMLNPDGVYRGHFRMDQHGQNLNRYYINPDVTLQPTIFAAKSLLDYYAGIGSLSMYLDMHAHASKRGCFIYGNVLDNAEDQIQNQLYCKLISMNTPHFDYEGCLFSREHMFRTDPGDQAKGLTAEGSGRVATYLAYGLVHSYTLECNYNTSRIGNEVAPPEQDLCGANVTPPSPFTTNPEKYTPTVYAGVGRACIIAMLDIRGQNPCSRIPKSKLKTLDRVRNAVVMEVRNRKEYLGKQSSSRDRRRSVSGKLAGCPATQSDEFVWRRVVEAFEAQSQQPGQVPALPNSNNPAAPGGNQGAMNFRPSGPITSNAVASGQIMFIPATKEKKRRSSLTALPSSSSTPSTAASIGPATNNPSSSSSSTTSSGIALQTSMNTNVPSSHSNLVVKTAVQDVSNNGGSTKYVLSPQSGQKNKLQDFFQGVQRSNNNNHSDSAGNILRDPEILIYANDYVDRSSKTPPMHSNQHNSNGNYYDNENHHGNLDPSNNKQKLNHNGSSGVMNTMGTSIRDLIREQSINKLIKMSAQQHSLVGTTPVVRDPALLPKRPIPFPASNSPNVANGTNANTATNSSGSSKDNRKILGKTLHAAGVALLINGSQAVPSLPPDAAGIYDNQQHPQPASSIQHHRQQSTSTSNTAYQEVIHGISGIAVGGSSEDNMLPLPQVPPENGSNHSSKANLDLIITGSVTGSVR